EIDRKLDRRLFAIGGEAYAMEVGKPAAIKPFFDPRDALVVDVDEADQVRDFRAVGIDALVLGQEPDARDAETMGLLLLPCREITLEPGEATPRAETLAHLGRIEIGQHGGEQLGGLVHIDELA